MSDASSFLPSSFCLRKGSDRLWRRPTYLSLILRLDWAMDGSSDCYRAKLSLDFYGAQEARLISSQGFNPRRSRQTSPPRKSRLTLSYTRLGSPTARPSLWLSLSVIYTAYKLLWLSQIDPFEAHRAPYCRKDGDRARRTVWRLGFVWDLSTWNCRWKFLTTPSAHSKA